ncbi:MAG: hypothetical protein E5X78_34330, partial [Mesorhizobium sp.]|uniref:hypothetical protein n=1 Tax=Mesorhizobium sp. TaxID=1871066 RepID=UPI001229D518
MPSSECIEVDSFYFLMSEPGVEDAVGGGGAQSDRLAGEGPAQAYGSTENGDEAVLLNAADEIVLGIFERLDSFAILARRGLVAIERHAATQGVVGTLGVVQLDDLTPTGLGLNASFA